MNEQQLKALIAQAVRDNTTPEKIRVLVTTVGPGVVGLDKIRRLISAS